VIDGSSDDNGTYTVAGMPLPYPASFTGTWSKAGNTLTFVTGAPTGIATLTNVEASTNQMTFVMAQNTPKTGALNLYFTLNKQ
jgi:hypothetical protein